MSTLGLKTTLLVAILGCARPGPAAPTAGAAVLDGLVVWSAPLEDAPPEVRERIDLVRLMLELFAAAPRPTVDRDDDPDAWQRTFDAAQPGFRAYEQRVRAAVASFDAAHAAAAAALSPEELRLYGTLMRLIEEHQRARYIVELRIGRPAFGSCNGGPGEALGDALRDTLELAEACIAQSTGVTSPLGSNADECRRRADWSRRLIATGTDGVCEPPEPGR